MWLPINVQDDEEIALVTDDDEISLTENESGYLFQDTPEEDEPGSE